MRKEDNLPIIRRGKNLYSIGGNLFFTGGAGLPENTTATLASAIAPMDPTGISAAVGAVSGIGTGLVDTVSGMFGKEDSYGATFAKGMLDPLGGGPIGALLKKQKADKSQARIDTNKSMDQYAAQRSMQDPTRSAVYAANGGELPGITQFNDGGTHEQNPLGGIPQGVSAANGQPNLVEQGETKRNGFIYSDRLPVIGAKDYNLPLKYEGKTFAEASKLASKYIEHRPNDPIAKEGQDRVLNRLKSANEEAIHMKEAAEQADMDVQAPFQAGCGGKLKSVYAHGGYIFTDY